MTTRTKVIRAVTAALLFGGAAFFIFGFWSSAQAENQATEVHDELRSLYAATANRPAPAAVGLFLALPEDGAEPAFPVPDGVHLEKYGTAEQNEAVTVVMRGQDTATGWCFRVSYTADDAPEVSRSQC